MDRPRPCVACVRDEAGDGDDPEGNGPAVAMRRAFPAPGASKGWSEAASLRNKTTEKRMVSVFF